MLGIEGNRTYLLAAQKVGTISLYTQHGFQRSQSGRVLLIERHQFLSLRQFLLQFSVGINNRQVDCLRLCNQFFHSGHQPTNKVNVLPQRIHTNTVRGAQPIQWIGLKHICGRLQDLSVQRIDQVQNVLNVIQLLLDGRHTASQIGNGCFQRTANGVRFFLCRSQPLGGAVQILLLQILH